MKISDSIVQGILSGGSQAEPGSDHNRSWNRYWDRFFKTCADHLLGYLVKNFPNLNHADAEDVIGPALMKTYRSLKENFDPEKHKITNWIFTNLRGVAIDLLRKKGRISRIEGGSLDAAVDGEDGLQLHETIGIADPGFQAIEDGEIQSLRKDEISEIFSELEAQGKCKREKIDIYKATLAGEKPFDIANSIGKSRSFVDSTKHEVEGRLTFIAQRMAEGVSLKDAVAQSRAKNKSLKNA
jgi:RNA polymerase sigma factor (sigma-70 family)